MGLPRTLLAAAVLLLITPVAAVSASLEQQRQRFMEARDALESGDSNRFRTLSEQLRDYPLYPYLVSWQLMQQSNLDTSQTRMLLSRYGDTPITKGLRERWLRQLATAGRWDDFLTYYHASNRSDLRCSYHYAQLRSGNDSAAWAGARTLWLSPNRLEQSCSRLFDAWEKSGGLTDSLRRQRLLLILNSGNFAFARQIAENMTDADRRLIELWAQVHKNPDIITSDKQLQRDSEDNRQLVIYGLQRIARSDAQEAINVWSKLEPRYTFSNAQRGEVLNRLLFRLAIAGDTTALAWYSHIPAAEVESDTRQWVIRLALRTQHWQEALNTLRTMPADERIDEEWQYWTARCLEALGEQELALQLYHGIASNSSYYGFLAADHLDVGYNLNHRPVSVDDALVETLKRRPEMVRAYELLQVELYKEARREWEYTIASMSANERLAAGKLANRWGWHDRAALTLAKADYFEDLEIRFPLAYTDAVMKEAKANTLDPAWVFAVARQESVMMADARSPVGALGLMQLMPATGRKIAQKLKSALSDLQQLLRPELNIRFGSYYLRELSDQFGDHKALATAAYNAGPNRVERWAPDNKRFDADVWIDTIPFSETRQYVRRVLAYSVFYDQRLDRPIVRLRDRLPAVQKQSVEIKG